MSRFDVYHAGNGRYLLDVQTDLIPSPGTRLVVPLLPVGSVPGAITRLHPVFDVGGDRVIMATHLLAAIPMRELRQPIGNLMSHYDEIIAALDMIFLGF